LIGSQQRADGYPPLFGGEWELRQNGIGGAKNCQERLYQEALFFLRVGLSVPDVSDFGYQKLR
jgi:hypothetical protein